MSSLRNRVTAPLAILLALAIAPSLTGCFGNPIEGIIEQATGGDVDLGGPGLPDGFPSAEVPIIDGEVLYGASIAAEGQTVWNVTVRVEDAAAFDTIKLLLEDAGFTTVEGAGGATADGAAGAFDTAQFGVLAVVSKDADNTFVANYTVTTKE